MCSFIFTTKTFKLENLQSKSVVYLTEYVNVLDVRLAKNCDDTTRKSMVLRP